MSLKEQPELTVRPTTTKSGLNALLIACGLTILINYVPMASIALYPIRLFVTFVHESSHALTAILTGGRVSEIVIHPDASGVTLTTGGFEPAIAAAGYLGATAFGAWLLALGRTPGRARFALLASALISGLATALCVHPWVNLFGFLWGVVITVGLVVARNCLRAASAELLAMFLGVQCAINALLDLRTLIELSVYQGQPTDAALMAALTGIPATVWALTWGALALVIVIGGVLPYWKQVKNR